MATLRKPCAAGFTLVEMMVAVALVVLLMGIGIPSIRATVGRMRLEGVVSELGVDLQFARAEAVRRQQAVALLVNAQGTGYQLSAGDLVLKTVALPADVALSADASIAFDGLRGTAAADAQLDGQSVLYPATLRVLVTTIGRLRVCTPDASFGGYPEC